jgi:hypothetical protein
MEGSGFIRLAIMRLACGTCTDTKGRCSEAFCYCDCMTVLWKTVVKNSVLKEELLTGIIIG